MPRLGMSIYAYPLQNEEYLEACFINKFQICNWALSQARNKSQTPRGKPQGSLFSPKIYSRDESGYLNLRFNTADSEVRFEF